MAEIMSPNGFACCARGGGIAKKSSAISLSAYGQGRGSCQSRTKCIRTRWVEASKEATVAFELVRMYRGEKMRRGTGNLSPKASGIR